ncbi:MAG: hypothetical protein GF365_01405|nr:hypothetical protein [Candidatus Buchananbacteria bacterium]
MPDPETILELMDNYNLDRYTAEEVADLMYEHDIDDLDEAVEMYETR